MTDTLPTQGRVSLRPGQIRALNEALDDYDFMTNFKLGRVNDGGELLRQLDSDTSYAAAVLRLALQNCGYEIDLSGRDLDSSLRTMSTKIYLGDSVYAAFSPATGSFDCDQITLTTENGPIPSNTIVIEPEGFLNLLRFARANGWDFRQWFPDWDEPGETHIDVGNQPNP